MPDAVPSDDLILPFQVEKTGVRGRLVRLGPVVDTILGRHDYSDAVSRVLGEALALTALLASTLKFEGVFILQAQSDGPVDLLVVDCQSTGQLRGYARYHEDRLAEALGEGGSEDPLPLNRLLGAGHLAFTVDQGSDTERYQGIVALEGASLADCAHSYFRNSEQLESVIKLAAEKLGSGNGQAGGSRWRAGGLMVQRMPADSGTTEEEISEDNWRRTVALMASARPEELLAPDLPPQDLLYRLYHEDGVRAFTAKAMNASCRCSRQRVVDVLKSFPSEEITSMSEDGRISVKCEFCSTAYVFSDHEVHGLGDEPSP